MARLNYNHLYYFHVIADEGSIKSACNKLHLSQPTISDQLKDLEEEFGKKLFVRKHRRLELSPYGDALFRKTSEMFRIGEEIEGLIPDNLDKNPSEYQPVSRSSI